MRLFDELHPIFGGNDTLRAMKRTFAYIRTKGERAVIQSPMATQILHLLPRFRGLLVVFLARTCLDVFRSQNKAPPPKRAQNRTRESRHTAVEQPQPREQPQPATEHYYGRTLTITNDPQQKSRHCRRAHTRLAASGRGCYQASRSVSYR